MKTVETPKRPSAKAVLPKAKEVSKAEKMLLNAILVEENADKNSPFYKKLITTSLLVARKFGKQHNHVLRDIKELISQSQQHLSKIGQMFEVIELPDSYGRMQPAYIMDKDGFTLLTMGFTGQKAFHFKLDYIDEFNRRGDMIVALEQRAISQTLGRSNLLLERFSAENKQLKEYNEECKDYIRYQPKLPFSTYAEAKQDFQDTVTILSSINIVDSQLKSKSEKLKHLYQGCEQSITPEVLAHESENKVYKQKLLNE